MSSPTSETRVRILNATWKLLEASQGSGVRMSDIAKIAGISRQAVYLHFPNRAELLIATTRHLDEVKSVDARLMVSRNAITGLARLEAFIEAWGNYIPRGVRGRQGTSSNKGHRRRSQGSPGTIGWRPFVTVAKQRSRR